LLDDRTEILQNGKLAEELKANPLLEKILTGMETKIINDWKNSIPEAPEIREFLYYRMEAVRKFRIEIDSCIKNATFERSKDKDLEGGTDE